MNHLTCIDVLSGTNNLIRISLNQQLSSHFIDVLFTQHCDRLHVVIIHIYLNIHIHITFNFIFLFRCILLEMM